jgi:hypothetical protein
MRLVLLAYCFFQGHFFLLLIHIVCLSNFYCYMLLYADKCLFHFFLLFTTITEQIYTPLVSSVFFLTRSLLEKRKRKISLAFCFFASIHGQYILYDFFVFCVRSSLMWEAIGKKKVFVFLITTFYNLIMNGSFIF